MSDPSHNGQAPAPPLPALLNDLKAIGFDDLHRRLHAAGYTEIRPGHGCVFRYVGPEGMRLTQLAELSGFTKQAVGEVAADLEAGGYIERVADPLDRRARIIQLTDRGLECQHAARTFFADIEHDWGEQIGHDKVAALREALEALLFRAPVPG